MHKGGVPGVRQMDLQSALSLLREESGIHNTAIEAFGATCSGVWTADCTLSEFAALVCDELPAFLSRFPSGYARPSSFDRVYSALRALFKSERGRAELGEERAAQALVTLKASWRSALDAEIRRRSLEDVLEAGEANQEADQEAEEAEEAEAEADEADEEPVEENAEYKYGSTESFRDESGDRLERVKSLFAEYVLAGNDPVKQRAVVARLIQMM